MNTELHENAQGGIDGHETPSPLSTGSQMTDLDEGGSIALLIRLEELGIGFHCWTGHGMTNLSPRACLALSRDPDGFMKKAFGFTRSEEQEWRQAHGCIQCAAETKSGRRCLNLAAQGLHIDEWLEHRDNGETCHTHGGES